VVHSVDQLAELLKDEHHLPCYIKGNYYKAYLVHHLSQAILRFTEISDEWGLPILVQKPVVGKEVNLIGLGDGEGNTCGMMVAKKLTTTSLGKFWTGVSISHPKLLELGERFVRETRWRGPFELECMETENGMVLIEINPRFPAWVYFATGCGLNLPLRLAQILTFQECPTHSQYEVGKLFVRYTSEIVTDLELYSSLMLDGGWKNAA
jgi:carbamoyl-phosphate synthase large subunit